MYKILPTFLSLNGHLEDLLISKINKPNLCTKLSKKEKLNSSKMAKIYSKTTKIFPIIISYLCKEKLTNSMQES